MSFHVLTCTNTSCWHVYEPYLVRNILPPCPRCGTRANGDKPPTREEYYRSFGITCEEGESNE